MPVDSAALCEMLSEVSYLFSTVTVVSENGDILVSMEPCERPIGSCALSNERFVEDPFARRLLGFLSSVSWV